MHAYIEQSPRLQEVKQKLIARRSQHQPIDPTRPFYLDEAFIPQCFQDLSNITRG